MKKRRILCHNNRTKNLKKIVKLHLQEGRTYKSITMNMEFQKLPFLNGAKNLEQCQAKAILDSSNTNELDIMQENLRLKKELEEIKKENLFLKKVQTFSLEKID